MQVKPIYEFVLWDNCRNSCKFCWKKTHSYKQLSALLKSLALDLFASFVDSSAFLRGSHVLLIGGEIFDDSLSKSKFLAISEEAARKMEDDAIDLLYINTNLINSDDSFIDNFIEIFKQRSLLSRLKFTTSYDVAGRFASLKAVDEWNNRMQRILDKNKDMKIVINCILTKLLCSLIACNMFNPVSCFHRRFGCYVSVLPYIPACLEYIPTRTEVFNAFKKIEEECPGYIRNYIQHLDMRLPKIVQKFNGVLFEDKSAESSSCGHCKNLNMYSTGKTCFVCDLKTVFAEYL